MKKLLLIIYLLPILAFGQNTNGTLQRQIASPNALTGVFGAFRDSLYTRAQIRTLISSYIPTLQNLTAANSTLTFSGAYNGSVARTVGLNLGNANTWTGLQTFNNGVSISGGGMTNAAGATLSGTGAATVLQSTTTALTTKLERTGTASAAFIGTLNNGFLVANSSGSTVFVAQSDGWLSNPNSAGSGDILIGADNNGVFRKVAIGSGLSYSAGTLTATGGSSGTINGSGTAGYLTKFTGAGTVGNSIITEATNNISINGADGTNQLDLLSGGNSRLSFGYLSSLMQIYSRNSLPLRLGVSAATTGLTIASGDNAEFSANGVPLNISSANSNSYKLGLKDGATFRGFLGASSTNSFMAANSSGTANFYVDNSTNAATFTGAISASNFSGTSSGTNTGDQDLSGYAPLASPALTGNPTAPTQSSGDNSTKIATTAYADTKLPLAGGTLTGALYGTTATFSGDVTANSDSTLKKNIKPLVSVSTALRDIGAYSYDWKATDQHSLGVIAQEVRKYFPELVKEDKKGILSVNYQNFAAVLLAGWKELDERISKLEQK